VKRRILLALVMVMMFSLSTCFALAGKPPQTALDVTISSPQDGVVVEYGGAFEVTGTVLAKRGDAGDVQTFVQYALGEGSTDFSDVGLTDIHIVSGDQPQAQTLLGDQSYPVSWTLTGSPGTYEIRIFSQGSTSKSGSSDSRTVTLLGLPPEPPPPGIETIDSEYQDPETGFGTSSGTYENTYYADGAYEILIEEADPNGTRNPTDDTTAFGWIYVFDNLDTTRTDTTFCFYGHMELSGEYTDSGFLEWDDHDTGFFVQENSSGSWKTIAAITNTYSDRMYSVDVPDDSSQTIYLRIVDNDRSHDRKSPQITSLYVDQAYIVYEPAFEYFIDDISIEIQPGSDSVRMGDIDNDGQNEVYMTYHLSEDGTVKYYDYIDGVWTEEVLAGVSIQGWLQVEDLDGDGSNELLTEETRNDVPLLGYHKYEGGVWTYYEIAPISIFHTVVVGDVDNDDDDVMNEVVVCKDPCDGYELRYYDYDPGNDIWEEINIRDFTHTFSGIEIADINHDGNNEIVWLGYSPEPPVGESALKYFELIGEDWVERNILNVDGGKCMDTGDVDNDGEIEIALGHYTHPERENQVRVYDYDDVLGWEEHIVADVTEALGPICDVAIGDVDNNDDGDYELAVGFLDAGVGLTNETIRYYEYDDIADEWIEHEVADTDMTVAVLEIGNVDNDSETEILVGLRVSPYDDSAVAPELRYYKVHRM